MLVFIDMDSQQRTRSLVWEIAALWKQ